MAELDAKIQKAYDSAMSGLLPERQAQRMIQQYDEEQIMLEKRVGLNVYNARRCKQYITSTYFVMFLKNGKQEMLNGNFIIKMLDDKTIEKVYEWNL